MSVNRNVIAAVEGVPEDRVKCSECAYCSIEPMIGGWCDFWRSYVRPQSFCSFYEPAGEKEESDGKID